MSTREEATEWRRQLDRTHLADGVGVGAWANMYAAALRAVLEIHKPREGGGLYAIPDGVIQCGHCADLCHSHTGLYCEEPADAVWPCPTGP